MHLRDLFGASDLPIGVELHAGGVRMLQARVSRAGSCVRAAAIVPVDDAGRSAEDYTFIDSLVSAVGSGMTLGRFKGRDIVLGLDARCIRSRSVRQARLSPDELTKAVRLDAPSRLGFSEGEGCELAWLRAGEVRQGDEVRDELIFLGVRLGPLERLLEGLRSIGLNPIAAEPVFTAVARCHTRNLRRTSDDAITRVIVDVGEASTEVMVTRGRSVAFYKQVELGGRTMTRQAAERLGLDPATVAELRRRRMTQGTDAAIDAKVERALFDAVRPLMNDLAQEVTLCLRYYSVTFRGSRPDGVLVVGQDAAEPQLAQTLGEALHVPTSVGQPLDGYDTSRVQGVIEAAGGPLWGACIGLTTRTREQHTSKRDRVWKARAAA